MNLKHWLTQESERGAEAASKASDKDPRVRVHRSGHQGSRQEALDVLNMPVFLGVRFLLRCKACVITAKGPEYPNMEYVGTSALGIRRH